MQYGLRFLPLLGFAAGASFAQAWAQTQPPQKILYVGRVHDQGHRAVEGVEVIVNRQEIRTTTNGDGYFTIGLSAADSTVGFRRIGYRPVLLGLHPLPPLRDTILVELIASQVQLPDLIVSALPSKPLRYAGTAKYDEVFFRQKVGVGTLITREAIDRRFGNSTPELLQGIPGVHVWNGPPKRIRFARCQEPGAVAVFIDGVRQFPMADQSRDRSRQSPISNPNFDESPEVDMLSRVDPSDIEMIEVYRGASQIPGVFHWNGCAVIAVWTKWNK